MAIIEHICNFSTGQVSPSLSGRFDLKQYESACKTLQNAIIMREGGARKRAGTTHMGNCKSQNFSDDVILIPFKRSKLDFCIIEVGKNYFRFWDNKGIIKDKDNKIVEIKTPYNDSDLLDLKYQQSGDYIYIVHRKHKPSQLIRKNLDNTEWEFKTVVFDCPPLADINTSDTTLKKGEKGTEVIASDDLFTEDDVGTTWMMSVLRENNQIDGDWKVKKEESDKEHDFYTEKEIRCKGQYNLLTHGSWRGKVIIERRLIDESDDWKTVREFGGDFDFNVNYNGDEKFDDFKYRIHWHYDPMEIEKEEERRASECRLEFTVLTDYDDCLFEITKIVDEKTVEIDWKKDIPDNQEPTKLWYRNEWSDKKGYPNAVAIYEERLWYASHSKIWASHINDWYNFKLGDLDTDGLGLSLPSTENIQWMLSGDILMIGTEGSECCIGNNGEDASPLTPTNISKVRTPSQNGSNYIQGIIANDNIIYCQTHGRRINEFAFSWQKQKYESPNLTLLASDITGYSGISQMCFVAQPQPILWCAKNDGNMIGLTYDREQSIVGWHKHDLGGYVEAITSVPFGFVNEDALWIVINRMINGENRKYVERFTPIDWQTVEKSYFLDSCLDWLNNTQFVISNIEKSGNDIIVSVDGMHNIIEGECVKIWQEGNLNLTVLENVKVLNSHQFKGQCTKTIDNKKGICARVRNEFTGLEHLEGKEVMALIDGSPTIKVKVKDGKVDLPRYGRYIIVGLPFIAIVEPMPFVVNTTAGASQPMPMKLTKLIIKFLYSYGAYIEVDGKKDTINWRKTEDRLGYLQLDEIIDKQILVGSALERTMTVKLIQENPLPMNVLNIMPYFEVTQE